MVRSSLGVPGFLQVCFRTSGLNPGLLGIMMKRVISLKSFRLLDTGGALLNMLIKNFEEDVLDDEVQRNEAIPLSDEEIALDASSEGTLSPGGPQYDYMMSSEEAKDDY
ncbi:hypothetical protein Tco_0807455 [Tanacetum coccineum]